jgi:hypothetical protein
MSKNIGTAIKVETPERLRKSEKLAMDTFVIDHGDEAQLQRSDSFSSTPCSDSFPSTPCSASDFEGDRNVCDKLVQDKPYYHGCVEWCEKYDDAAFDSSYRSLDPELFRPVVDQILLPNAYWWDTSHVIHAAFTGAPQMNS